MTTLTKREGALILKKAADRIEGRPDLWIKHDLGRTTDDGEVQACAIGTLNYVTTGDTHVANPLDVNEEYVSELTSLLKDTDFAWRILSKDLEPVCGLSTRDEEWVKCLRKEWEFENIIVSINDHESTQSKDVAALFRKLACLLEVEAEQEDVVSGVLG